MPKRQRQRRPSLEERLDAISALRREADRGAVSAKLRSALGEKNALVVGRAARVAADLGLDELATELESAFERFLEKPVETDPSCAAKGEIAKALVNLDLPAVETFRRGLDYVQMEPAYGEPVDTAIEVRANCAIGLANSGVPGVVLEILPRLLDPGLPVRLAAVRAIAAASPMEAEGVLRFKLLVGDEEPEVLTECLVGLLDIAPNRSMKIARGQLDSRNPGHRQAAMLALGESRREEAVELLIERWAHEIDPDARQTLLLALVTSRRGPALEFLLAMVAGDDQRAAAEALEALSILRHDPKLRERIAEALEKSPHRLELSRLHDV